MFVEASAPVPLPLEAARNALIAALTNNDLAQESGRAYAEGLTVVHQVEAGQVSKRVRVRTLPSRELGRTTVMPIRWEAIGLSGDLFPVLDADLCLTPVNEVTSLLSLIGRYAPPLGTLGTVIDRTVLSGTAQASVDTFLRGLSAAMRDCREREPDRH